MIQAQQMHDGGVDVVNVIRLFHRTESDFVGSANGLAALHTATGHPHGEAPGIMIPTILCPSAGGVGVRKRRASEFPAPHYESIFQ